MSERKKLELLIGEMAAQAGEEAVREEVLQQIDGKPWVQEQWHDLLQENDCLRKELNEVDVPDDLEDRLLEAAELPSPKSPDRKSRLSIWAMAVVAILLVAIGLGIVWQQQNSRMQTVALLAINNHLNHLEDHGVESQSRQPAELTHELSKLVEFDVFLPDFGDRLNLVGGRKCKLGTRTVAFTLWNDAQGNYSLFQFQPDKFGIPPTVEPKLVHASGPAGEEHHCGAWIWTDGTAGYVLVGDPGCEMKNLKPVP